MVSVLLTSLYFLLLQYGSLKHRIAHTGPQYEASCRFTNLVILPNQWTMQLGRAVY